MRVAALSNRVPTALALLAAYLAIVGRGVLAVLLASALVAFLLLVTDDLDRPTRGMIRSPRHRADEPADVDDTTPRRGGSSRSRR